MQLASLLLSLLGATIGLVTADGPNCSCCGSFNEVIIPPVPVNMTVDTALNLGQGWQPFFFGGNGTWAVPSNTSGAFYLLTGTPSVLRVTDAFRPGDRFAIYINGTDIGDTSPPDPDSTSYTTSPYEAWVNGNFSSGSWTLPPGLHRITIEVLFAVEAEGSSAFIRADFNPCVMCGLCRPPCPDGPCRCSPRPDPRNPPGCCANSPTNTPDGPICRESSGEFVMLKTPMTRDNGIRACQARGMHLADVTSDNFVGVNSFAFRCNDEQTANSWVRSWNGDAYQGACLVLTSSSYNGLGAITAQDCTSLKFVMCQA